MQADNEDTDAKGPKVLRMAKAAAEPSDGPAGSRKLPDTALVVIAVVGLAAAGVAISELSSRMAMLAAADDA